MLDKLNELKIKVNNIHIWNIEIIKEEIYIFINTYIKNEYKRNNYIEELKYSSFNSYSTELENEYFNPWWTERNRQSEIRWFNNWKKELNDLLVKIELFLQSNINIEEKKTKTPNININTLNNHWNFALQNNWIQDLSIINNEIEKFLELIEKNDINNKEEIKNLLNEFQKTNDKGKIVDIFSILWNWASINSMIIALNSLINSI